MLEALARHDLAALRERVRSGAAELGLTLGPGRPCPVDPVPRVIEAAEWERLRAGLGQRTRALNEFLLDVYGAQRIFEAGVVPRRLLETSAGYEPRLRGLLDPSLPPATVAGLDLVRDADGEVRVLEDNLRMPSGAAYSLALRELVEPALGAEVRPLGPRRVRPRAGGGAAGRRARRGRGPGAGARHRRAAERDLVRAPPPRPRTGDPGRHPGRAGPP